MGARKAQGKRRERGHSKHQVYTVSQNPKCQLVSGAKDSKKEYASKVQQDWIIMNISEEALTIIRVNQFASSHSGFAFKESWMRQSPQAGGVSLLTASTGAHLTKSSYAVFALSELTIFKSFKARLQ